MELQPDIAGYQPVGFFLNVFQNPQKEFFKVTFVYNILGPESGKVTLLNWVQNIWCCVMEDEMQATWEEKLWIFVRLEVMQNLQMAAPVERVEKLEVEDGDYL